MNNLDFVNPINHNINYREDQKELIQKAINISDGNPLNALQYIVSCIAHEEYDVEFELILRIPERKEITITLPIVETKPQDELGYYVMWGDNHITHNTNIHKYKANDETKDYHIRFFGLGIFGFGDDHGYYGFKRYKEYLTKVISFGKLGNKFKSLAFAFNGCVNNFTVPQILPSSVNNLRYMFTNCIKFNQPLVWDTSNVTRMEHIFDGCTDFNQQLVWNTSNVTHMEHIFDGCTNFNQPLVWNTSNVTNMSGMFFRCTNFNQPLEFNTSKVTDMSYMFRMCINFNQPLQWNTSNVKDMYAMFYDCIIFDQSLTSWNISNVKNKYYMFTNSNISKHNRPYF